MLEDGIFNNSSIRLSLSVFYFKFENGRKNDPGFILRG